MKRRWSAAVLGALLLGQVTAGAADAATGDLVYLGTTGQGLQARLGGEPDEKHLMISARVANILIRRQAASTSVLLRYAGGQRMIPFNSPMVTTIRVAIQRDRPFTIEARRHKAPCYARTFRIAESGAWRLDLPC